MCIRDRYLPYRALPDSKIWRGYDLSNEETLRDLAPRIHHNTHYSWDTLSRTLINGQVPKLLYNAVRDHCETCWFTKCMSEAPRRKPVSFAISNRPFQKVYLDFIFWSSRKIIHIVDACTQFSGLRHIPEITHQTCKSLADASSGNNCASENAIQGIRQRLESEIVVELLHQVFTDKGYPDEMWFDRDGTVQSTVMVSMCQEFGTYAKFVPPGHHSSYGALER